METLIVVVKKGFAKQLMSDINMVYSSTTNTPNGITLRFRVENAQNLAKLISEKDYVIATNPPVAKKVLKKVTNAKVVKKTTKIAPKTKKKASSKKRPQESEVWFNEDDRPVDIIKSTTKAITYKYQDSGRGSTLTPAKFLKKFSK